MGEYGDMTAYYESLALEPIDPMYDREAEVEFERARLERAGRQRGMLDDHMAHGDSHMAQATYKRNAVIAWGQFWQSVSGEVYSLCCTPFEQAIKDLSIPTAALIASGGTGTVDEERMIVTIAVVPGLLSIVETPKRMGCLRQAVKQSFGTDWNVAITKKGK